MAFAQGLVDATRREAVLSHIEGCPICAGLAAEAARDGLEATMAEPIPAREEPPRFSRGTSVGRYLLLERIGAGALGQVFTAYDPELDRKVAIKLLLPGILERTDGPEFRARFSREAQALARVKHPNVVAVHDVGEVDGQLFIAMELVEGQTLRAWLATSPGWAAVRDVFLAAGEGLRAAHEACLVHRDFKPSNVLLDAAGRVRVADFGLARSAGGAAAPHVASASSPEALEHSMTASGAFVGTPAYMSPEQHRRDPVDARADQFAFCVALFEGLYGERPFRGETIEELSEAVQHGRVVATSGAAPAWLRRVVLRGLSTEPDARHPSMAELLAAMQQDRTSRKRRFVTAGVAVVALAGGLWTATRVGASVEAPSNGPIELLTNEARAAAAKFYWVYPPRLDPAQPTAYVKVLALEGLEGPGEGEADARADELREEFAGTLVRLGDEYWDRPGGAMFATDYYAAALVFDDDHPRALERARLTPIGLERMRQKAADLTFTEGELAAAEPLTALALAGDDARRQAVAALYVGPPKPPSTTTAAIEELLGPVSESIPQPPVAEPDPEPVVIAESEPSKARTPRTSRAPEGVPEVTPAPTQEASGPADPEGSMAEAKRGLEALQRGRIGEAETHFHAAVGMHRHNDVALAGLGEVYFQREAFDRAAKFFERAVAAAPNRAKYRMDLGDLYLRMLRYDDARAQYIKAKTLGHVGAEKRIAKLDAKTGGEP